MSAEVKASCVMTGEGKVRGEVTFTQSTKGGPTTIEGTFTGLSAGKHGFHVHQFGDLSGGCKSTGGHFNPFSKTHGGPQSAKRHVGDLGNVDIKDEKSQSFKFTDSQVNLVGPNSIIGRAMVIHAGEDDLGLGGFEDSLTTGHAGGRLACGVIGIKV